MIKSFSRLGFDEAMERAYRTSRNRRLSRRNVLTIGLLVVAYDIFLLTDFSLIPDVSNLALVLRLAIISPIVITFLLIQHRITARNPDSALPGQFYAVVAVMVFASVVILQAASSAHTAAEYFTGCLVVMVAFNCVRLGAFADQCAGTVAMCLIFSVTMPFVTVMQPALKADATLSLYVCATLTLLGAYRNEYIERASFRSENREQQLREMLARQNQELHRLSRVDALTSVANRRCFDETLDDVAHRGQDSAVLMVDVDFFKLYNDHYGHTAGDTCLVKVAEALSGAVRRGDCVARYGGEEFAIILHNAAEQQAAIFGERIRAAVDALALPHAARPDGLGRVTVSIGVQTRHAHDPLPVQACVAAADAALYRSKRNGRNTCTMAWAA